MLIVTQHQDDVLVVRVGGQEVRIFINRIRGSTVRLAIDAPPSVEVQRLPPGTAPEPEVVYTRRKPRRTER